jgi:hypothetical protein
MSAIRPHHAVAADEEGNPITQGRWEAVLAELDIAKRSLSEERSRAERAESIADMSAIELIRSCTVSSAGTDYRDPMGEDLEPELAYAVARGLVELDARGWLRFTEYAWQRCSEEAPK